ncbi:hypothetical protein VLK81_01530 [Citroniella saccharovorans]|uniref:Uncharacterized protein n=1 Tax=Citroniella saccharovorans TaxID=2053367 RepID=A0AAW9MUS7_9FIRM|nr:hypothetical protein [Citroniella saccharovorans]MEB3428713.1 hypothetical protein [Citroniella saccharovorans]
MLIEYGNLVKIGFILMSTANILSLIVAFSRKDYSFRSLVVSIILLISRLLFFINEYETYDNLVISEAQAKNFFRLNKYLLIFDLTVFIVGAIYIVKNRKKSD